MPKDSCWNGDFMITTATKRMIPELKKLWKLCFHDEDNYIDFYYKNRFIEKETLVYLMKEKVVAMLTIMPGFVVHHKSQQPVRYVYAVATHPDHRRHGYSAALLEYANETSGNDYVGTFLVPASQSLFRYYEALGYRMVSDKRVLHKSVDDFLLELRIEQVQQVKAIKQLTKQDFLSLRSKAFEQSGYVMWESEALEYVIREFMFLGGCAYKVMLDKEEGAFLYYIDKDTLVIKETTLTESGLCAVIKYLKQQLEFVHITIILSKASSLSGETTPFVMAYADGFQGDEYVNLVLD
jgi:predicted acetyltransferase